MCEEARGNSFFAVTCDLCHEKLCAEECCSGSGIAKEIMTKSSLSLLLTLLVSEVTQTRNVKQL